MCECPHCKHQQTSRECLRGVSPDYRRGIGYFCTNKKCELFGVPVFEDTTAAAVENLIECMRQSANWKRRQNPERYLVAAGHSVRRRIA